MRRGGNGDADPDDVVEVSLEDLVTALEFGPEATPSRSEAVAIAAAVGAHVTDREREARESDEGSVETVDPWSFAGRLDANAGGRQRYRPGTVERGTEWRAAARTR